MLCCISHPSLVSCFLPVFSVDVGLTEGCVIGTGCQTMSASWLTEVKDGMGESRYVFER